MRKLTYLASPYSDPCPAVRESRYLDAVNAVAYLSSLDMCVYSPIVSCHPIATKFKLPVNWETWKENDELMLSLSSHMVILRLPEWEKSKGISEEILICRRNDISVSFLDLETVNRWVVKTLGE